MKRSRVWLALTGLAFVAWIGYLVYLTRQVEKPSIILSRPQFLIAEYVVIGHVDDKHRLVLVDEVVFPPANAKLQEGDKVQVENLRQSLHNWTSRDLDAEWDLPGEFILPLHVDPKQKDGNWSAVVVALPPSPGLPMGTRIYPKTPGTMEQLRSIPIGK